MALTNEELLSLISNLTSEEKEQLLVRLNKKIHTKVELSCPLCNSVKYKKHGKTKIGLQRYICKKCGKTFSENQDSFLRYSHLSDNRMEEVLKGYVNAYSLPHISREAHCSVSTAWKYRMKLDNVVRAMYE